MGNGPGTMGMPLGPFLVMWVAMMVAMMFPSVAPVAILWSRMIVRKTEGLRRASRLALFVGGYLLAWTFAGVPAYAGFAGFESLLGSYPAAAGWVGAIAFLSAGLYQLTPLKDYCLRHCRTPTGLLSHYTALRGPAIDLRVGILHGLYCLACCWGLMVILVAVGVMNLGAMVLLTAVIFAEKVLRAGPTIARATGWVFLAVAIVALFRPDLFPGLAV